MTDREVVWAAICLKCTENARWPTVILSPVNESTKQVRNDLNKHGSFVLALSMILGSVSRLLHCVLRSLGDWLLVICRSFEAKPIVRGDRSNCSCEASLVGDKAQNNSLLSTSATLASLYEGLLCFSVLTYFSKVRIFHATIENGQLLQYGHTYQLNDHTNVKTMDARTRVLRNGAKTETFAPQNDRATERNVNFLLTATVL